MGKFFEKMWRQTYSRICRYNAVVDLENQELKIVQIYSKNEENNIRLFLLHELLFIYLEVVNNEI